MVLVKTFCLCCSLRCGSIIIGLITMMQWIMIFVRFMIDEGHCAIADNFLKENNALYLAGEAFLKEYYCQYVDYVPYIFIFFCLSAIIEIIACFKCMVFLIIPFLISFALYIIALSKIYYVTVTTIIRKGDYGIGMLILTSTSGFFILIFHIYEWICVATFIKIITELRKLINTKISLAVARRKNDKFHMWKRF